MTTVGSTAERDKHGRVTGNTEKSRLSPRLPELLHLDSGHGKPDAPVRPEMGTRTQLPELWSNPYRA